MASWLSFDTWTFKAKIGNLTSMPPVRRLPDLEELKKLLERDPDMLMFYAKADSLIGSSDAIKYLNEMLEKKKEGSK